MIDAEAEVFTLVAGALHAFRPELAVYGETLLSPPEFPCVCIEEADNYVHTRTGDSGCKENHVRVMYEINVYSNKTSGKKSECKSLLAIVDETLLGAGFVRTAQNPITLDDATKYRLFARYTGVVSRDHVIYRR